MVEYLKKNLTKTKSRERRMVDSSKSNFFDCVDEIYFSLLCKEDDELQPISDEKYAEELQFQEVLISSLISTLHQNPNWSSPNERNQEKKASTLEIGQSSNLRSFCEICMEEKQEGQIFRSNNCSHVFCSDCIGQHIAVKIQESINMVKCPDLKCRGVLEPKFCQSIIPEPVFKRWENALCESMVLESQIFYCPFKDCSAFLVDDGGEVVTQSECPCCRRLFCARCKVVWHSGVDCEEFQRLGGDERGKDDLMVIELAKKRKWKRCPTCKFYVEKTEGCLHITCRCGFQFCYGCGLKWTEAHTSCHS